MSANSLTVFIVENSQIIAVSLANGDEKWHIPFVSQGFAQIFSDDEMVLIGEKQVVSAFNSDNGRLLWKADLPGNIDINFPGAFSFDGWRENTSLVKQDNSVYIRVKQGGEPGSECDMVSLIALDADNGEQKWQYSLGQSFTSDCIAGTFPLSFSDKLVLIPTFEGVSSPCNVKAVDKDRGQVIWDYVILEGCSMDTRSIFLNEKFIIVSSNTIFTIDSRDGKQMSTQIQLPGKNNQVISSNGIIIGRTTTATDATGFRVVDLHTGKLFDFNEITLPNKCDSPALNIVGNRDQIAFVRGRCILFINLAKRNNE
jgi:outer membrane protein assembly factor BamB